MTPDSVRGAEEEGVRHISQTQKRDDGAIYSLLASIYTDWTNGNGLPDYRGTAIPLLTCELSCGCTTYEEIDLPDVKTLP